MEGDLAGAVTQFGAVVAEAEAAHDAFVKVNSLRGLGFALAYQGEVSAARAAADAELKAAAELVSTSWGLATRQWRSRPWPPAMLRRPGTRARRPRRT